jgi:hypothetical protein
MFRKFCIIERFSSGVAERKFIEFCCPNTMEARNTL